MSSLTCQHCGGSDIDTDPVRGDSVCTNCGSVLEEDIIVSEVQFEETGRGGSAAVGQFVSSDGKCLSGGGAFHHGLSKESKAVTLQIGKRLISELAQPLQLKPYFVETAFNIFKMAVTKRFTRGRIRSHVVAACLYIVCRTEESPPAVMLLDISDIIQVNVYTLGHTYLALSNLLCIKIPPLDPSLYIIRFAHKLELGDKTHVVSETASRLVQRMKRDWLNTGRRPSGLCGAALLVSARMHNFCRTTKDIIKIVKVCETTLKKRLTEFGETPSSHLTLEEFMTIDLEEEQDPPAFKAARLKAKLTVMEQQIPKDVDDEIGELQREIEKALQDRKVRGRYAKYMQSDTPEAAEEVADEDGAVQQFLQEETIDSINAFLHGGENPKPDAGPSGEGGVKKAALRGLRPTPESLGLKQSIEECMRIPPKEPELEDDGHLDLTGIDDEEIDCYIMNESEAKIKTDMWNELNADYLKEMQIKEERLAREREENAGKPEKKKRKVSKKQHGPASTAGEAIEKMLQEKRISNKINYEVLWNLSDTGNKEASPDVPKRPIPQLQNTPLADRFSAIFKPNFEASIISPSKSDKLPSPPVESSPSKNAQNNTLDDTIEENEENDENDTEMVQNDEFMEEDQYDIDEEEEEEETAAAKLLRQIDAVNDVNDAYDYDDEYGFVDDDDS